MKQEDTSSGGVLLVKDCDWHKNVGELIGDRVDKCRARLERLRRLKDLLAKVHCLQNTPAIEEIVDKI